MKIQDVFHSKEYMAANNVELALYKLAEELGIPKEDIQMGVYDDHFDRAKVKIIKALQTLMPEDKQ
jgi:hypothetical protein